MIDEQRAIRTDEFLAHPPAAVWRALTDPDRIAQWLMPNDFAAAVGHRFTMRTDAVPAGDFDGVIHCEVLAVEPERLLRYSWRSSAGLDTTVTWTLAAEGRGTRLFLEHAGFDPDNPVDQFARAAMDRGWRGRVWRALTECLAV